VIFREVPVMVAVRVLFTWTTTVAIDPWVEEDTIEVSIDIFEDDGVKRPLKELLIDRDVVPRYSRLDERYVSAVV
jgi:hypothetical protein